MEPLRADDPRQVGRYRLVARLGAGGMGQVFLGFSPAGRPVAVKVVHPELARDKAFLSRFRQETAAARRVSGAYTASVVDAGEGDRPWLATTLVVGPSLADAVEQQGPLPEVSVWRLAAGLAEALAEVHRSGLIHRDLKPSNVLLAADGPRVIDFGISRALDGTSLTGTGMVVGTPSFMSPEQATGIPVGPASDVFSFGGVVTFAAAGAGPFGDGSPVAMIYRVVHGEPALDGLPGALHDLVTRCLAKRPDDRATLPELMEIITARVEPATSATSFWPEALTGFITSYQASFAEDAQAWPPAEPRQAEPPAEPQPEEPPQPGEPPRQKPAVPPGAADLPVPADVDSTGDHREWPDTITVSRRAPSQPSIPTPPPDPWRPATSPPDPWPSVSPPRRAPRRRRAMIAGIGTAAAAVVAIVVVLATSLSSGHTPAPAPSTGTSTQPPGGFGVLPAESGTPHAGTVSVAEQPGGNPTWILPLVPAADNTISNVLDFDDLMWRPLYWTDTGVSPVTDAAMSLARPPTWSNGDKTVTITMNPGYKWSDGQPVTSRDVAFAINLIKAALREDPANWLNYNPGYFPDDVASVSTPDLRTLVLNLTSPINPNWYAADELASVEPMPAHAWARASAGGPLLDDGNPADAKKIYDYLATQSKATGTWTTSPLWRVVDGPFRLISHNAASGAFALAANPAYGGPSSHQIKALNEIPFSTYAAEFAALRAGSVDVGQVPPEDISQAAQVKSAGYNVFGYPDFVWTYAVYNFKDATGDFNHIVAQLYFRQAMAHLQDQQGYIRSLMNGAGSPDYGPVPPLPASPYTPGNAANTYPFSVATARSLLAGHGWKVTPGGTDTCSNPGSGAGQCGAGIPGGTRLAFNLVYNTDTPLIGQEMHALAAEAKQAGIAITLVPSNFNSIIVNDDNPAAPGNANKWAMEDFGGLTLNAYPTSFTVFNTPGNTNIGSYSDPQADRLIKASVTSPDPNAVKTEAAYLTAQQPGLFQPNADLVFAWKKTLSGPPDSFASLTQYYLTPELWYLTG